FRQVSLCRTLGGNDCPVITATGLMPAEAELRSRPALVVTARVHPGESNGSYVAQGFLRFITSDHPAARELRERFVMKV
ncbi:unnamed protein product, partial [Discosporangium mesarthrocarpum]